MKIKKLTVCLISAVICIIALCISTSAALSPYSEIIDDARLFSEEDKSVITDRMRAVSQYTGFNIIIMTSDDVGSAKTDSAVVDMCDVLYEQKCGKNTDGVLFLINLDTRYHYLSTSGSAINYLSDARIDSFYDFITPDMRQGEYKNVAMGLLTELTSFYDLGKANDQQEVLGMEVEMNTFWKKLASNLFIGAIIAVIVGFIAYSSVSAKMKLQKPSTRQYILKNSLHFTAKQDDYIGTFTNRVYSPQSSSSGGSSHHSSGHSSTHHSSGGGRHGGGGRHI